MFSKKETRKRKGRIWKQVMEKKKALSLSLSLLIDFNCLHSCYFHSLFFFWRKIERERARESISEQKLAWSFHFILSPLFYYHTTLASRSLSLSLSLSLAFLSFMSLPAHILEIFLIDFLTSLPPLYLSLSLSLYHLFPTYLCSIFFLGREGAFFFSLISNPSQQLIIKKRNI